MPARRALTRTCQAAAAAGVHPGDETPAAGRRPAAAEEEGPVCNRCCFVAWCRRGLGAFRRRPLYSRRERGAATRACPLTQRLGISSRDNDDRAQGLDPARRHGGLGRDPGPQASCRRRRNRRPSSVSKRIPQMSAPVEKATKTCPPSRPSTLSTSHRKPCARLARTHTNQSNEL